MLQHKPVLTNIYIYKYLYSIASPISFLALRDQYEIQKDLKSNRGPKKANIV